MHSLPRWITIGLVVVLFVGTLSPRSAPADQYYIPNPPTPSAAEILQAAGLTQAKPAELEARLASILNLHPLAADAWLPSLEEREREWLLSELSKLGLGNKSVQQAWVAAKPKLEADLRQRRLEDPRRLTDSLLRELGKHGTAEQLVPLSWYVRNAQTPWGRWKFYAAMQEILLRHDLPEVQRFHEIPIDLLAVIVRNLPPERRGEIANALWQRAVQDQAADKLRPQTRLWLAWSISSSDPETALTIFRPELTSRDPYLRLMAGMGILRISSGDAVPFRLTAAPDETQEARAAWLANLELHPADDWYFPNPLALPVIREHHGGRVDLWWLNTAGKPERTQEDVWPTVMQVLPDGTFCSRQPAWGNDPAALTAPDGSMLAPAIDCYALAGVEGIANHGGLCCLRDQTRQAVEYATDGSVIWACPTSKSNVSARGFRSAPNGQFVLIRYGQVEVIDRRGDVLWSVHEDLDDPRDAQLIAPDTLLICCTNEIRIQHRTRGLLERLPDFTSCTSVRYHPTMPWVIFDAGTDIVLWDPQTHKRTRLRLFWKNDEPAVPSQYQNR